MKITAMICIFGYRYNQTSIMEVKRKKLHILWSFELWYVQSERWVPMSGVIHCLHHSENGENMFLWNAGTLTRLHGITNQKTTYVSLLPCKFKILENEALLHYILLTNMYKICQSPEKFVLLHWKWPCILVLC
jgi:hypothetical protein